MERDRRRTFAYFKRSRRCSAEGDVVDWVDPPFSGKIVDGKVYGRGTTDMKGGLLASLIALESLITLGIRLKGDVIFQSVVKKKAVVSERSPLFNVAIKQTLH